MNWIFAMAAPQGGGQANPIQAFLPLIFIFVIFYFLLIRPQQKKQKETKKMLEALKKNDKVITAGGIHGTVMNVKERTVMVKIADNVKIEVNKSSVVGVLNQTTTEENSEK